VKTNRDSTTLSVTSEITYLTVRLTESPDQRDFGKKGSIAIVREFLYILPFDCTKTNFHRMGIILQVVYLIIG
jgi:hypothetical protein